MKKPKEQLKKNKFITKTNKNDSIINRKRSR